MCWTLKTLLHHRLLCAGLHREHAGPITGSKTLSSASVQQSDPTKTSHTSQTLQRGVWSSELIKVVTAFKEEAGTITTSDQNNLLNLTKLNI